MLFNLSLIRQLISQHLCHVLPPPNQMHMSTFGQYYLRGLRKGVIVLGIHTGAISIKYVYVYVYVYEYMT